MGCIQTRKTKQQSKQLSDSDHNWFQIPQEANNTVKHELNHWLVKNQREQTRTCRNLSKDMPERQIRNHIPQIENVHQNPSWQPLNELSQARSQRQTEKSRKQTPHLWYADPTLQALQTQNTGQQRHQQRNSFDNICRNKQVINTREARKQRPQQSHECSIQHIDRQSGHQSVQLPDILSSGNTDRPKPTNRDKGQTEKSSHYQMELSTYQQVNQRQQLGNMHHTAQSKPEQPQILHTQDTRLSRQHQMHNHTGITGPQAQFLDNPFKGEPKPNQRQLGGAQEYTEQYDILLETIQKNHEEALQYKKDTDILRFQVAEISKEKRHLEEQLRQAKSSEQRCQNCWLYKNNISGLKEEINSLRDRHYMAAQQIRVSETRQMEAITSKYKQECDALKSELQKVKTETNKKAEQNEKRAQQSVNELSSAQQMVYELRFEIRQREEISTKYQKKCAFYKSKVQNLTDELQNMAEDLRQAKSSGQRCQNCWLYKNDISELKKEINSLRYRHYEAAQHIRESATRRMEDMTLKYQQECDALKSELQKMKTETKMTAEQIEKKTQQTVYELTSAQQTVYNLTSQITKLEEISTKYKQESEFYKSKVQNLTDELQMMAGDLRQAKSSEQRCQNCWRYKNDISDLKKEINSLRDRLSEAAGNKLRDNNPNIADLSDMNRPTSLAEKFSSLYTDAYTDAMEVIEGAMDEAACVDFMLQMLKQCNDWCEKLAEEQRVLLHTESIGFINKYLGQPGNFTISQRCFLYVKEFQKKVAFDSLAAIEKVCLESNKNREPFVHSEHVVNYIKKCSELCWMMQISDPPLYLKFDVRPGDNVDRNLYNVFTKSGNQIRFLVWPAVYLHKTGPILVKGVVQGM